MFQKSWIKNKPSNFLDSSYLIHATKYNTPATIWRVADVVGLECRASDNLQTTKFSATLLVWEVDDKGAVQWPFPGRHSIYRWFYERRAFANRWCFDESRARFIKNKCLGVWFVLLYLLMWCLFALWCYCCIKFERFFDMWRFYRFSRGTMCFVNSDRKVDRICICLDSNTDSSTKTHTLWYQMFLDILILSVF